jgi:hypothetical protein
MDLGLRKQADRFPTKVFFTGTTALRKGVGVCYVQTAGTAANIDESRRRDVALPTTANHNAFAGIVAQDYAANASGQMIEIYKPGSVCLVETCLATVVNSSRKGLVVGGAGEFFYQGLDGPGRVLALQTVAVVASDDTGLVGPVGASVQDTYTIATRSLNSTAAFTNAAVGDRVIVFGGSNVDGSAPIVAYQETTIQTVTDANNVILTDALVDTAGDDLDVATAEIAFACVRGYPLVLALVEDLPNTTSGCVEYLGMLNNDTSQSMVGGTTVCIGGVTLAGGDAVATLADGTIEGEKKAFRLAGAMDDYTVTVTSGMMADLDGALASLELDGDGDVTVLQWHGNVGGGVLGAWVPLLNVGTTQA